MSNYIYANVDSVSDEKNNFPVLLKKVPQGKHSGVKH